MRKFILVIALAGFAGASPMAKKMSENNPLDWASLTTNQKKEIIKQMILEKKCEIKGIKLFGKVQFVEHFPDFTIQYVEHFPDLKVQMVNHFPDKCGKWQSVQHFPDFKVKVVEHFPDLKVQLVEYFPGLP